jgi:hypothetical protein
MKEKEPQQKEGEAMEEKDIVGDVREKLISELKDSLKIYGPNWVNKESCTELIEDLEARKPTRIGGPFCSDQLDGVLSDLGMERRTDGKYEAIWKKLEEGEVKEK